MFKLIKWTVVGTVSVGAIGWFLFGDHAGSYLSTIASSVREGVRGHVPVEFQLKRAQDLINEIEPQIHGCKRDLAQAEVALDNLVKEVEALEHKVVTDEKKLKMGASLLTVGSNGVYRLAGGEFPRRRVELDLERTLDTHRLNVALLRGKKSLIEQQTRGVVAARQKVDAVRTEKVRLEDMIGTLKAQKAQIDVLAAGSRRFDLDDGALSKAKEVLTQVRNDLAVAQKLLEQDIIYDGGLEADVRSERNVIEDIHAYFGESAEGRADAEAPAAVVGR